VSGTSDASSTRWASRLSRFQLRESNSAADSGVEEAAKNGFKQVVKDPPLMPGQKVFTGGVRYLTKDADAHSGGG